MHTFLSRDPYCTRISCSTRIQILHDSNVNVIICKSIFQYVENWYLLLVIMHNNHYKFALFCRKNVPDYSASREKNDLGYLTFDLKTDILYI